MRSRWDGRSEIRPGQIYAGPLLVADAFSTLWSPGLDGPFRIAGSLLLGKNQEFQGTQSEMPALHARIILQPVSLPSQEMGAQLERTAL